MVRPLLIEFPGAVSHITSRCSFGTVSIFLNQSLSYTYNNDLNRFTIAGSTSNYSYTYDPMGKLLTVTKDGSLVEEVSL